MTSKLSQNVMQQMEEYREAAIPQFTYGVFCLASVALPLSLSRSFVTGWQFIYSIEIVCFLVIAVLAFFRTKIKSSTQAWVLLLINLVIAIFCLFTFGIVGGAVISSLSCVLICVFFINARTAIFIGIVLLIAFLASSYLFVFQDRQLPLDGTTYVSTLSSWGTVLFGSVFFIILVVFGVFKQRRESFVLISQLEERTKVIEQQKRSLEHLANHDPLTGLPSLRLARSQLEMTLTKAKLANHQSAVFFLDLDGFKKVNDRHGHATGDYVLKVTALRIISTIRTNDTACRIGGDEFIIIIEEVENREHIEKLCFRLIEIINQAINFEGNEVKVGVSIGAVIYPKVALDAKSLLQKADELMYQVKANGKNSYKIAD
jgi:diguanylate cyclase (GGDEF)-like protein